MIVLRNFFKTSFGQIIIRFSISIIIALSIILSFYYGKTQDSLSLTDGFTFAGGALIAIGFFACIINFGFLDFASYGFYSAFNSLRKGNIIKYNDLMDYKEKKAEKRSSLKLSFLGYLIPGIILLIIGIIFAFTIASK